jgi:hypothetical protein
MPDVIEGAPPVRGPRLGQGPDFAEFTVEVDPDSGRNYLFNPTQEWLRNRWSWDKLPRGSTSERGLAKLPTIPGIHVTVSPRERRAVVWDPLSLPENAKLLREVEAQTKHLLGEARTAVPRKEYRNLSNDALATWLYWVHRAVLSKDFREVKGKAPTLRQVVEKLPRAQIRKYFYDSQVYGPGQGSEAAEKVQEEVDSSYAAEGGAN